MAKKITLKNKNGDTLCPHTAIEQVQGLKEVLDGKLALTGGVLTGDIIAPAFETTSYSGQPTRKTRLHSTGLNICGRENAGWAGGVAVVDNQASSLGTIAGAYGDSSYSPSYYFYGGAYNNSALKLLPDGRATFKNTVIAPTFDGMATSVKDGSISTSKIADTAITSAKLASSLILKGTPQLATQPTLSSESQNIASVGLVKKAVENIEIGGTNLILNSDFSEGTEHWTNIYWGTTISSEENILKADIQQAASLFGVSSSSVSMEEGRQYIVSFDVRSESISSLDYSFLRSPSGNMKLPNVIGITPEWQRFEIKFQPFISEIYNFSFGSQNLSTEISQSIEFRKVKLERGSIATDWSPAPEDVEAKIDDKLGKEEKAVSAADADKLEGATKDDILQEASKESVRVAGDNWTEVGKVYVDGEIAKVKNGDVVLPSASETIYGVSRLAKLDDVTSQNDSSSNDDNVAVTPNTLWRYMLQEKTDIQEQIDGKLGKTEKAVSAKTTKVSKSSEADPNAALSFYAGQAEASTTPTADKVYVGSRTDGNIISVPELDGTTSMANYMNLRMSFSSKYFHEIAVLPNRDGIYHRNVRDGNALEWKQLLEGLVTTSKIADTAITPVKIQTDIALNGTPSMTVEPTTSSPDKTIASVGLVKKIVDNVQIGGRNLVLNSSTPISSTAYFIGNLPLYENLIENSVYTITIWGELGADRTSFYLYPEWGMGGALCELQQVSNGVYNATFIYHKGNATNSNAVGLYQVPSASTSTSTIERIKIEKGNKATDWSPAPEDVQTQLNDTVNDKLEGYASIQYVNNKVANIGTPGNATETGAGIVRAATQAEVTDGHVSDNDPAEMAFVRPETLQSKLSNYPTTTAMTQAINESRQIIYYQSSQPSGGKNGDIWIKP